MSPAQRQRRRQRRASAALLAELDKLDSREDRVLETLLRRGARLERRLDEIEARGRVVPSYALGPLGESLARMRIAIRELREGLDRAEAAAPENGSATGGGPTPAERELGLHELAARIRRGDAESDRLRTVLRERLSALEEKAGPADLEEPDPDEDATKPERRGVTYRVKKPPIRGRQIRSFQRALNRWYDKWGLEFRVKPDGYYGPQTRHAARRVAYLLGLPSRQIRTELTPEIRRKIRHPERRSPAERERARRRRPFLRKLRKREKAAQRAGKVIRPLRTDPNPTSEFNSPDREGAPRRNGGPIHAGKDWYAPGGTKVRAPVSGKIVEAKPSKTNVGQVFGGTVKIQAADGKVWVFRHVDPRVQVGHRVRAGQGVATVTHWRGGSSHAHIEVWKSLVPTYKAWNMIDPMVFFRPFVGSGPPGK